MVTKALEKIEQGGGWLRTVFGCTGSSLLRAGFL